MVVAAVVTLLGLTPTTPAHAAGFSHTIDGVTYEGDDGDVGAGLVVTAYDEAYGLDPVIPENVVISGTTYTVTTIGASAFRNKSLTSIDLPDTVTQIQEHAFSRNALTSIDLPLALHTIGDSAFFRNSLVALTIPDGVRTIGSEAFSDNSLSTVTIPTSVTTIGVSAFYLNSLTSIVIPDSVIHLEANAFASNDLTSVTIPASMTKLENGIFYSNQLTSVSIPAGVTSIGEGAFAYNQLEALTLPPVLETIANDAFYGNRFESLTIPAPVSAIGTLAFAGNTQLSSVYFRGNAPTVAAANWLSGSFDTGVGTTLYFTCTAAGFTTPSWQGYDTVRQACEAAGGPGELAPTGADVTAPALAALALIAVGLGLLGLRRGRLSGR